MSIVYILLALLMLCIMVTIHEWGHFIAARMTCIPVREFSIGFGSKLVQWHSKKHETVFSIRAIPAGGYCAFYGEDDPDEKADEDPRAMRGFPVWKRLITVFMGPMMNFVLAFLVGIGLFWIGGQTAIEYDITGYRHIAAVNPGSAADLAGLRAGDVLKSVNGVDAAGVAENGSGDTPRFSQLISQYGQNGAAVTVVVSRGEEDLTVSVVPQPDSTGRLLIGIVIEPAILSQTTIHPNLIESVGLSARQCVYEGGLILESLGQLVSKPSMVSEMSGPIGVISYVAKETQKNGPETYVLLLIFISVNLGLVNLMPIPGLDGARIILLLVEGVRRKPLSRKTEAYITMVGFAALMILFVTLTYQDIVGIFRGTR